MKPITIPIIRNKRYVFFAFLRKMKIADAPQEISNVIDVVNQKLKTIVEIGDIRLKDMIGY